MLSHQTANQKRMRAIKMNLLKTKITNLDNKSWFSFENRQALNENKDNYKLNTGDLVIFYSSNVVWKIQK